MLGKTNSRFVINSTQKFGWDTFFSDLFCFPHFYFTQFTRKFQFTLIYASNLLSFNIVMRNCFYEYVLLLINVACNPPSLLGVFLFYFSLLPLLCYCPLSQVSLTSTVSHIFLHRSIFWTNTSGHLQFQLRWWPEVIEGYEMGLTCAIVVFLLTDK